MEKRKILNDNISLDTSKSFQDTDVPTETIKENADIFAGFIHPAINTTINKNEFASFLKLADVIPVFQKSSKNSKDNYRPISVLKNISKIYEIAMFKQIGGVKCHLLMSTLTPISIKVKDYIIKNRDNEKLLGVTIDTNLNFICHLENILKKGSKKVHALARITSYLSIPKRKLLMNSFFTSQFNYCPLTWMCHSRTMNNKINRLHERCLRIVHSDKTSSFEKLLEKDGSVTIHTRNLQTLATEMFKVDKNLSPPIIADLFHVRQNNYNLRHDSYFAIPNVKSVYHGTESLSNLGPRIWNLVPDKLKQLVDIHAFKKEIKKWKPENCPCRLCKTYIPRVGFI